MSAGASAQLDGLFVIESDGVTIDGFHIINGAGLNSGSEVKAIFVGDSGGWSDTGSKVVIKNNLIENVAGNPYNTTDAIQVKFYNAGDPINGVEITDNVIRNITNSTADFGAGGRGANGIKLQADVNDVTVDGNSISDLTGLWNWGVTLTYSSSESGLPDNVTIINNSFSDLNSAGGAVGLESGGSGDADLPLAPEATIHQNNFSDFVDTACGVVNKDQDGEGIDVDAENNWWDDANGPGDIVDASVNPAVKTGDGPGNGVCVSEYVDFDPFASSAF